MDTTAAQPQYENENGFASDEAETQFPKALRHYKSQRTAYHLANLRSSDIDTLVYEAEDLLRFGRAALDAENEKALHMAAYALLAAFRASAEKLAEDDADDADYDTIMGTL